MRTIRFLAFAVVAVVVCSAMAVPADARTRRCGNVSGPFNIRVTATGTSCDIAKRVARHAVVQAQYGANPFSVSTLGQRWTCRVLRDGESISCSRRSGRVGLHPDY